MFFKCDIIIDIDIEIIDPKRLLIRHGRKRMNILKAVSLGSTKYFLINFVHIMKIDMGKKLANTYTRPIHCGNRIK